MDNSSNEILNNVKAITKKYNCSIKTVVKVLQNSLTPNTDKPIQFPQCQNYVTYLYKNNQLNNITNLSYLFVIPTDINAWETKNNRADGVCLLCGTKLKCDNNGCLQSSSIENHLMQMHNMKKGILKQYGVLSQYFNGFNPTLNEKNTNTHLNQSDKTSTIVDLLNEDNEDESMQDTKFEKKLSSFHARDEIGSTQIPNTNNNNNNNNNNKYKVSLHYTKDEALSILFMCENRIHLHFMDDPLASSIASFLSFTKIKTILPFISNDLYTRFKEELNDVPCYSISTYTITRYKKFLLAWNSYSFYKNEYHSHFLTFKSIEKNDTTNIINSLTSILCNKNPECILCSPSTLYAKIKSSETFSTLQNIRCFYKFLDSLYLLCWKNENLDRLISQIESLLFYIRSPLNYTKFTECVEIITGTKPEKPALYTVDSYYGLIQHLEWLYKYGIYAILFLNHVDKRETYNISMIQECTALIPYFYTFNISHLILCSTSNPTCHLILPFLSVLKSIFNKDINEYLGYDASSLLCVHEFVDTVRTKLNNLDQGYYYDQSQLDFLSCSSSLYVYLNKLLKPDSYSEEQSVYTNEDIQKWMNTFKSILSKDVSLYSEFIIHYINILRNTSVKNTSIPSILSILSCSIDRRDTNYIECRSKAMDIYFKYKMTKHEVFWKVYEQLRLTNSTSYPIHSSYYSYNNNEEDNYEEYDEDDDDYKDNEYNFNLENTLSYLINYYFICPSFLDDSTPEYSLSDDDDYYNSKAKFRNESSNDENDDENDEDIDIDIDMDKEHKIIRTSNVLNCIFKISNETIFKTEKTILNIPNIKNYYSFDLYYNDDFYSKMIISLLSKYLSPPATQTINTKLFYIICSLEKQCDIKLDNNVFCDYVFLNYNIPEFESMLNIKNA